MYVCMLIKCLALGIIDAKKASRGTNGEHTSAEIVLACCRLPCMFFDDDLDDSDCDDADDDDLGIVSPQSCILSAEGSPKDRGALDRSH